MKFKKTISVCLLLCILAFWCAMGVAAEGEAPAPQVTVSAENVEVVVGKTVTVKAAVANLDGAAVTWSSDDTGVATVDENGVVKGVSVGRATITATASREETTVQGSIVIYVIKSNSLIKNMLQKKQRLSYQYSYVDDYYYVNDKDCWQSNFGFGKFYDYIAPYVLLEYDYVRVYFTYENKDYMIQFWKGQYGLLFYGAEQGIYSKGHSDQDDGLFTFYKCADREDWATMEFTLYRDVSGNGNYVRQFTRDTDQYWWCTGFKQGHLRVEEPARELRSVGSMTFRNEEMATLFAEGLRTCGFGEAASEAELDLDQFCINGTKVSFIWQNINDAETTMPIKIAGGTLFAINAIAILIAIMVFIMIGLGILVIGALIIL